MYYKKGRQPKLPGSVAKVLSASRSSWAAKPFRIGLSDRAPAKLIGWGHLLLHQFNRYGPLPHLLLRSTQALITQMEHMAVRDRPHSVDRLSANELTLLQIPLQYA